MAAVASFAEKEFNGCVSVKAAQTRVQELIRREHSKMWKAQMDASKPARESRKGRQRARTTQQPRAEAAAYETALRPRPPGVDPKFKTPCKQCGAWGHHSNYKA